MSDFYKFDLHLQDFTRGMVNFNYDISREVWPESYFNNNDQNHFWNKFLECDREPLFFYSRLDVLNRERLYDYITLHSGRYRV